MRGVEGRDYIATFLIDGRLLRKMREIAEPEHIGRHIPPDSGKKPWRVDARGPDQYALPGAFFEEFQRGIIPGSGEMIPIEEFNRGRRKRK